MAQLQADLGVQRRAAAVGAVVVTLAVYARLAALSAAPAVWVGVPFLVALAIIDWNVRRLPTAVIYVALTSVMFTAALVAVFTRDARPLVYGLLGMCGEWAFWRIVKSIYGEQMGWGDVRLGALLGLVIGPWGLVAMLAAIFVAMLAAVAYGIVKGARYRLPLGTFLVAGALAVILIGPEPLAGVVRL